MSTTDGQVPAMSSTKALAAQWLVVFAVCAVGTLLLIKVTLPLVVSTAVLPHGGEGQPEKVFLVSIENATPLTVTATALWGVAAQLVSFVLLLVPARLLSGFPLHFRFGKPVFREKSGDHSLLGSGGRKIVDRYETIIHSRRARFGEALSFLVRRLVGGTVSGTCLGVVLAFFLFNDRQLCLLLWFLPLASAAFLALAAGFSPTHLASLPQSFRSQGFKLVLDVAFDYGRIEHSGPQDE